MTAEWTAQDEADSWQRSAKRWQQDRDYWWRRAVIAEADADRLADEVDRWGHGDFHYGPMPRDRGVLEALAAHDEALKARADAAEVEP